MSFCFFNCFYNFECVFMLSLCCVCVCMEYMHVCVWARACVCLFCKFLRPSSVSSCVASVFSYDLNYSIDFILFYTCIYSLAVCVCVCVYLLSCVCLCASVCLGNVSKLTSHLFLLKPKMHLYLFFLLICSFFFYYFYKTLSVFTCSCFLDFSLFFLLKYSCLIVVVVVLSLLFN